jgi:predicted amidohydrolase/uncharacterized protein YndB with AHSA1/START domain
VIIALASPRVASSLEDGLERIQRLLADASAQGADVVCFPEAYLPGLRGQDFEVWPFDRTQQERALQTVAQWARTYAVATILGMERLTEAGRQIAAWVIDARGQLQGYQTKNQLDPSEDRFYVPGDTRQLFEVKGVKFGVAICHEGWRYPETVRWAAVRGAKIVFHPHQTGSDRTGVLLTEWGASGAPYYEKAMMLRSIENTIYFASVNYAHRFQESATSLIDPSGRCQAYLPYGEEGVLVQALDLEKATGLLAARYAPERYRESGPPAAPAATASGAGSEDAIVSARVLDAPRELVFRAFADPRHLSRWWGPEGFTSTFREFDLRPGGAWRLVMRGPNGTEYDNANEFVEVVAPARIVFDHLEPAHRFRMTMTFDAEGPRTRLTWRMRFASAREAARVRAIIVRANEENFDRLAAELRAIAVRPRPTR